jgi:flagellin-like hook-associated protein FlgL
MSVLLRAVLCMPLLVAAGCASFAEPPGITYAKSVENLGITPVYPPREDLQVGDLYSIEDHTHDDRFKARNGYLDTLDLTAEIQDYLRTRYKFGDTSTGTTALTAKAAMVLPGATQKEAVGTTKVPGRSDLMTLPITGLPEIEVNSGISIGVAGQPKGLAAAFGLEAAKTSHMSLRFGQVTSYGVPPVTAAQRLQAYCAAGLTAGNCRNSRLNYVINLKFGLNAGERDAVKSSYILMVDKVYLARQITYTFDDATVAAAAISSQGSGAAAAPIVNPTSVDKAVSSDNAEMVKALADMQTSLNGVVKQQGPNGGQLSFAGSTENGVSFTEVFARPVVVGYEAVAFAALPN